jgi:hypothetical protein
LEKRVRARLTAREGRKFGLTVGVAFFALTALMIWRDNAVAAKVTGSLGARLVLGGLLIPARLGPVHAAWMGLAHAISKVTTPIFMGIVYFLVLAPVGMVMRLFGRNPMRHEPVEASFWKTRASGHGHDLRRQF